MVSAADARDARTDDQTASDHAAVGGDRVAAMFAQRGGPGMTPGTAPLVVRRTRLHDGSPSGCTLSGFA